MIGHGHYELSAIHDGHHEIGDYQVRPLFSGAFEPFMAVDSRQPPSKTPPSKTVSSPAKPLVMREKTGLAEEVSGLI
jgi:hypothetical protein